MLTALNFSTNQLRTLAYLLRAKSVTETAIFFETSQPAVSRLLADMRDKFGDPLLIRSGDRMVITDRGREIRGELEILLDRMSRLLSGESAFDPSASEQAFSLGFTDSNMVTLVPAIVAAISKEGPKLRTRARSVDPSVNVVEALETRDLDVVVDCVSEYTRDTYPTLRYAPIGSDEVVLLTRNNHPMLDAPPRDFAGYAALKHVAPFPISDIEKGPIDGALAALKTPRRIHSFIPEYNLIPYVLLDSDLVFTTCRRFAEHYAGFLPLSVTPAPAFFPKLEFRLLWHDVTNSNRSCVWLRNQIVAAAKLGIPRA